MLPSAITEILNNQDLMPLGPGVPNETVCAQLRSLAPEKLFPDRPLRDPDLARCCLSAIWLRHNFLDESHTISQEIEIPEGSFWHAIMHRREPDAWNSKYWWRRVGAHPVLEQLRAKTPEIGYKYTTPDAFVDFCERARDSGSPDEELAKRVQFLEWQLLFDYCMSLAIR